MAAAGTHDHYTWFAPNYGCCKCQGLLTCQQPAIQTTHRGTANIGPVSDNKAVHRHQQQVLLRMPQGGGGPAYTAVACSALFRPQEHTGDRHKQRQWTPTPHCWGGGGGGTTPTCQASTSLPERDRRQPHMCQCQPKISNTKQCSCSRCSKGYFSRAIDTVHVTCTHPVTVVAHIQPTPRQQVTCMQGSHAKVQAHKHLTGDMVIPLASTHGEPPTE